MSKTILAGPVEGQQNSGIRRALRVVALAPVLAGGLTFVTANLVRAEDAPASEETPTTEAPAETPTTETPTTEAPAETPTTEAPAETPTTEAPAVVEAAKPVIDEIVARPGALTVKFTQAAESNPLFHVVQAKLDDQVKAMQVVVGDVVVASLGGLVNGTEYDVTVSGIELGGFGTVSDAVQATPVADGSAVIAPLGVEDIEVVRSRSSATVTWAAPANDGGSPIAFYVVNAVDQSTGQLALWRTLPGDVRSVVLAPLTNGIAYDINVFAVSGAGFGEVESLADILGSSALENPLAPTLPWAKAYVDEDGKVVANWGAAQEHGVPVEMYNAVIVQDDELVGWNVVGPLGRAVEVTGLDPTQDAEVYVFTTSGIGFGEAEVIAIPGVPAEEEEG